jgi:hypothetical protein
VVVLVHLNVSTINTSSYSFICGELISGRIKCLLTSTFQEDLAHQLKGFGNKLPRDIFEPQSKDVVGYVGYNRYVTTELVNCLV